MVNSKTKKGTEVFCYIHEDCGSNKGGFFVEICLDENGDRFDDMVVHPSDCDCTDRNAVERYVESKVQNISEY